MAVDKLVTLLASLGDLKTRADDDAVDRLSRRYTTFFLVLFAILVSTKQYVGDPINCWVPAQFTANHEVYSNRVCWVSNTYYLPFEKSRIPRNQDNKDKIGYYQWIPLILIVQAIMFYIPCILWRLLHKRSGINLMTIIDAAVSCHQAALSEARDRTIRYMVNHIDSYVGAKREEKEGCWHRIKKQLSKRCFCIFGTDYGNYMTCVYLIIKLLYIANCTGQLFLLNLFLDTDFHMFGINVVMSLMRGDDWRSSFRFPRVTLCDFEVRQLGNIHKHTVQCVLPINLFNEKIFVFIWFWFVFVAGVTALSFLQWLAKSSSKGGQAAFIKKELVAFDRLNRETVQRTKKFANEYLKQDGVFIVRMIAKNAGEVVAAEVISGIWDIYVRENRLLMDNYPTAPPAPPEMC